MKRRVPLTVAITLLIVVCEFMFLHGVYGLAGPVRDQKVLAARYEGRLAGEMAAGSAIDRAAVDRDTDDFLSAMTAADADPDDLSALSQAASNLVAARPGSITTASDRLRLAAKELRHRIEAKLRGIDRRVDLIYAGLLVAASLGWMLWFRRLVARHRSLQKRMSEAETRRAGERRLGSLVRNSADVIAVCSPESTVSFVSESCESVLGVPNDELSGARLLDLVHPEDEELVSCMLTGGANEDHVVAVRMRHSDGGYRRIGGTLANRTTDPDVGGIVVTIRDVTEQFELQEQLTHQAFHDSLTSLANRQLFIDRLNHALERREPAESLVVAFCDLDDFKNINDTMGHGLGDEVLVHVADRLRSAVRPGDTVARLGGDEFAILMEATPMDVAQARATELLALLGSPVDIDGRVLRAVASIGLAEAQPGVLTSTEVLRNADVAMYLAKNRGKATVAVYDETLHAEAIARRALHEELEYAIRDEQFVLHYQPTVDLGSDRVIGFEALVRWEHPTRGTIGPDEFIPGAERSGNIVALGTWVLREACRAAASLPGGADAPYVAVNVAAKQWARPGFVDEVVATLQSTGLPAYRLVLEITESDVLIDLERTVDSLTRLRAHGVRVAMDDFGTGYSSLAYLSRLPIDLLKLDKTFVDRITTSEHSANLIQAIITIGQSMNFRTVAEGVERSEQADWLAAASCTSAQGFLWSRPVPLAEALQLVGRAELRPAAADVVALESARHDAVPYAAA